MQTISPWAANLGWMAQHSADMRRRLTAPSGEARLQAKDGLLYWKEGVSWTQIVVSDDQVDAAVCRCQGVEQVVVVGAGLGEVIVALLHRTNARVVAWDRTSTFARPFLQHHDVTRWLADGRLQIAIGADLLDHARLHRELHPTLGAHYRHEVRTLDTLDRPVALVVSGTLFFHDLCDSLEQRNVATFSWDVHTADEPELRRTAQRLQPRWVLAINHTHGLAEACDDLGVPLIEWEIDPSTDTLRPTTARSAHVFTWRRSQVERYRRNGYRSSYLPLATNPARRSPTPLNAAEQASYGVPVAYVGSSMVKRGNELAREFVRWFAKVHPGTANDAANIVQQLLAVQRQQGDSYVVPAMLQQIAPLLTSQFAQAGCPHRPDMLVGEAAAAEYRLSTLALVAPLGLHVWGDAGWKALERYGATWRGWAGHYHELNRIYSGAAVHVDVGRLYQLDIVPMRIFDVLACGGFVIAQHSEALSGCLKPGVEIETWRTPQELVDKVRWYKTHERARRYMVSAGRARVLREHTIARRLEHMLTTVADLDLAMAV